jgi:hypothetical protein
MPTWCSRLATHYSPYFMYIRQTKTLFMKKIFLLVLSWIYLTCTYCQSDSSLARFENDTLYTKSGYKIYPGEMLKIGTGTMPDGDFKYIRIASTSLFQYVGDDKYRTAKNAANSLSAQSRGLSYKVVRIDKLGRRKNGFVYYPIINVVTIRYQIDVDLAIESGELEVPDQYRPKPKTAVVEVKQQFSLADELAKLKKLYDDSVLTKDEYEAAKKKLLEKQ